MRDLSRPSPAHHQVDVDGSNPPPPLADSKCKVCGRTIVRWRAVFTTWPERAFEVCSDECASVKMDSLLDEGVGGRIAIWDNPGADREAGTRWWFWVTERVF